MLRVLQVYILDAVAKMSITDAKDAESIVERVIPRLQHANSAVVLSAVKVSSTAAAHQLLMQGVSQQGDLSRNPACASSCEDDQLHLLHWHTSDEQ